MKKVGILTRSPNEPELIQILEDSDVEPYMFFEDFEPIKKHPEFACMFINEAYGFDGQLIATNISTALKLCRLPSVLPKIYYIRQLEWPNMPQKQYESLKQIYDSKLRFITNNREYARVIKNVFNKDVEVKELSCLLQEKI